ncbi:hypothetical protein WM46_21585 [Citrobacter freundii complex sp. CFNIH2]|nr:hypothetical protein WM46_21585 [Citrobacter freundii complex sp. CFNIH2]AVI00398.1 hypothetical protein AL479_22980 [Citrobacter amalonaticus]
MSKTKAPQGRFSLFSGLCLSLYPAGSREGFPRRQHPSFEHVVEVPVCVDTVSVSRIIPFASESGDFLGEFFSPSPIIY